MRICTMKAVLLSVFLFLGLNAAEAQNKNITGKVTCADGVAVGASIVVKGTTRGAIAGPDGSFKLMAAPEDVLVISLLGYEAKEIAVGQQSNVNVFLEEMGTHLSEVVVVGFGTQRKADLTTAITSVDVEEMLKFPASNASEMLRGRVAGLTVTNTGGRPGTASSIDIRGVRSLNSGAVLYVIDGVVASSTEFNTIAPEEIATIDVAKDAAAQAIYGARAADGIIYVTTKRGKTDEYRVSVNTKNKWTWLPKNRNFSFYSAQEWYNLRAEAIANDIQGESTIPFTGADIITQTDRVLADYMMEKAYEEGRSTNWEDLMFKTAFSQEYNISVTGGNEKLKVAAIAGYNNEDGMLKTGSGYERGNLRLNMDMKPFNWMNIGFSSSLMKSKQTYEDGNFTYYITRPPLGMPYDEDGNIAKFINASQDQNPLWNEKNTKDERNRDHGNMNGYIEIIPVKGLSAKTIFSYRNISTENSEYRTSLYPGGSGAAGSITNSKTITNELNNILSYNIPFTNEDHRMTLVGVHSYFSQNDRGLSYKANKVPVDDFWWNGIADGEVSTKGRSFSERVMISYAVRLEYMFKNRYMLNAVLRRDGSSKFGANNKWGTFPAVSVAWRISEESFLKDLKQINDLKLRASYGVVGSEANLGNYDSKSTTVDYEFEFGDTYYQGYLPGTTLTNPNLRWEQSASFNVGLDFSLLDKRLKGEINAYVTTTSDVLNAKAIENALGYTSIMDNVAKTRSRGFELAMNGDVLKNSTIKWNVGMTFATFDNKILKLNGRLDENGNPADNPSNGWFIGHPISVIYEYMSDGIYQYSDFDVVNGKYVLRPTIDTDGDGIPDKVLERTDAVKPGKIKIIDRNGDGQITADDRYIIRNDTKWNASLSTSIIWKRFDFYMDWYGTYGRKIRNAYLSASGNGGSLQGKLSGVKVNYWTPTNPSNEFPRPSHNSLTSYLDVLNIQDASYLRLRTVSLGYTLPGTIANKLAMKEMRVSCTLNNLFTHSDFLSFNPEATLNGYPEGLRVMLGLNVTF